MAKAALQKAKKKKLPEMTHWSDEQIAHFWETHDSTDYLDEMEDAEIQLDIPKDFRVVTLPLGREEIEQTKKLAKRKKIPYTTLLQMWIKEKLEETEAGKSVSHH